MKTGKLLSAILTTMAGTVLCVQAQSTNRVLALTNAAYASIPSASKLQNPSAITIEAWTYSFTGGFLLSKSDGGDVFGDRSYELGSGPNQVGVSFFLEPPPLSGALHIANAGFENPLLSVGQDNASSGYNVPGWVEFDEQYPWAWDVYRPDTATMPALAHGDQNVLNSLGYRWGTQYVEQQLGYTVQSNTRYTLSAWAADPDPHTTTNSVRLMLFGGSTLLGTTTIRPTAVDWPATIKSDR